MNSSDYLTEASVLFERERSHLRAANRALRDAREALFFGDEDTFLDLLQLAEDEHSAADVCGVEACDLMGRSSDSSRTNMSEAD